MTLDSTTTPDCVCAQIGAGSCPSEHPDGYNCTRPVDHAGPHVACGMWTHQGFEWVDSKVGELS